MQPFDATTLRMGGLALGAALSARDQKMRGAETAPADEAGANTAVEYHDVLYRVPS